MPEHNLRSFLNKNQLEEWSRDSIQRLTDLLTDLNEDQMKGPYSRILNPTLWEATHAMWFLEHWSLRDVLDRDPYFEDVDDLYNSILIRHGLRWARDLIPRGRVVEFSEYLQESVSEAISEHYDNDQFIYRLLYSTYHNDMHTEALTFQRQSRGLPAPTFMNQTEEAVDGGSSGLIDDQVEVPSAEVMLGSPEQAPFVFDNEKWAHPVELGPFKIDRTPITQGQYLEFVENDGYRTEKYWSKDSWEWLNLTERESPRYWKRKQGEWQRRQFDRWMPLKSDKPIHHVSWYEARAYCRWAGRRLPTEAEWHFAALGDHVRSDNYPFEERFYPWGNESPASDQAYLDWNNPGPGSVLAHPNSESPFGCRQMIGNVWEWTLDTFEPFDDYTPDFYEQYSKPWFGSRKCMRGGSWCTRSRLIRADFRNFYTPDRNDRYLGFRTCERK